MDWQQGDSEDKHIQFIPAEKGWLALFEESTGEGVKIHADPVIAWCLGAQDLDDGHHVVSFGQAVIGASPWLEKADAEQSTHFFALVREEQLDQDFLDELKVSSRHSREDIMIQAKENQAGRSQGHASWRRQRRGEKSEKISLSPLRLFSMSQ
jgi:hypothetical protein